MHHKLLRPALVVIVLAATVLVFVWYISHHPNTINLLRHLPPATFGLLLLLYGAFLGALVWIQYATLKLCGIRLGRRENWLLIMYSSIINFFGPLQSGPAFRAAYLKRRHGVKLANYTVATLLYYLFYALFSGLFLLTYFIGLPALLGIVAVLALVPAVLRLRPNLVPVRFRHLQLSAVSSLAVGTLLQVCLLGILFYVELNSLELKSAAGHVALVPALIYTGAANFALFVSITPGAIGFRESFLVFSEHLHHIGGNLIVAASLLDRGVYVTYLGLLAIIVFGLHAQNYFKKP